MRTEILIFLNRRQDRVSAVQSFLCSFPDLPISIIEFSGIACNDVDSVLLFPSNGIPCLFSGDRSNAEIDIRKSSVSECRNQLDRRCFSFRLYGGFLWCWSLFKFLIASHMVFFNFQAFPELLLTPLMNRVTNRTCSQERGEDSSN